MADAILDRIIHHSHRIDLKGPSLGAGPTRIAASDGAAEPFAPKKIVIEFHKDRYACNLDLALTIAPPWWVQWWVGREMAATYQRIACNFPRQMPSGDDGLPRHKR
jgi:hypothetical protein